MIRRRPGPVVLLVLGLLLTSGCSVDDAPDARPPSSSPATTTSPVGPPPLTTRLTVGRVTGRVAAPARIRVVREVGSVVDRWTDAAFLAGDYPRGDFRDDFPGFTRGAAIQARRDWRLMSNADIGRRVDEVHPRKRRVLVDLLGVRRKAVAATARFYLSFRTVGDVERIVVVRGRLRLVPIGQAWRVFAYDVSKGTR